MYGVHTMSKKDKEAFLQWHTQQHNQTFDFRVEMEQYCRSDVDILRRSCMKFRQLMLESTGLDPFAFITIASVCMAVFRTNFMMEKWQLTLHNDQQVLVTKTRDGLSPLLNFKKASFISSHIAKVPAGGYSGRDNYSHESIKWLEYEAQRRGIHIRHALNGGEVKVPNGKGGFYKLDGCVGNNIISCYPYSVSIHYFTVTFINVLSSFLCNFVYYFPVAFANILLSPCCRQAGI